MSASPVAIDAARRDERSSTAPRRVRRSGSARRAPRPAEDPEEVTSWRSPRPGRPTTSAGWPALGLRDVGENRDQEAAQKARACADLDAGWHFVGQLQRNKARSVAAYADVVQSVDRLGLVTALDRAAARGRAPDRRLPPGRPRRPAERDPRARRCTPR